MSFICVFAVFRASKPAPMITLEHTSSIEDMILKRIIDGKYNDVLPPIKRKEKPEDAPELSQEKDQMGLGEIYANEYLAKTLEGGDADGNKRKGGDDEKRAEIKSLFMKVWSPVQNSKTSQLHHFVFLCDLQICRNLDALSHFHYTPKPVNQEGAVTVHNLPSLMMEDIAPSDSLQAQASSTHAPEEVMHKPRARVEILPEAERTSEDRHRFRNASKRTRRTQRQRDAAEAASAASAVAGSGGEAASVKEGQLARLHESRRLDEQLRGDKRVLLSSAGDNNEHPAKRSKSSAQFFANYKDIAAGIQDVKKAAKTAGSKDKGGAAMSAGRMKL
jgi:U3 small nucleolar RNA-associated protein MPP10